jgi:hypothetical protein
MRRRVEKVLIIISRAGHNLAILTQSESVVSLLHFGFYISVDHIHVLLLLLLACCSNAQDHPMHAKHVMESSCQWSTATHLPCLYKCARPTLSKWTHINGACRNGKTCEVMWMLVTLQYYPDAWTTNSPARNVEQGDNYRIMCKRYK